MSIRLDWDVGCEFVRHNNLLLQCGKPSHFAYRTMGGGWQMCCTEHGEKHAAYSVCRDGTQGNWCDKDGRPLAALRASDGSGREGV